MYKSRNALVFSFFFLEMSNCKSGRLVEIEVEKTNVKKYTMILLCFDRKFTILRRL